MRIIITTGSKRPKPKAGDMRETKKHGKQIRIPVLVCDHKGNTIGYDCTGGKQRYQWCDIDKIPDRFKYLLK